MQYYNQAYLQCKHCIGLNCQIYFMKCDIIKTMPCGKRFKIKVYGNRNWKKHSNDHSKIRYVSTNRIVYS